MKRYIVSEDIKRYKIFISTKNTRLINGLKKTFAPEQIGVESKIGRLKLPTLKVDNGEYIMIIYDLYKTKVDPKELKKEFGDTSLETVFILKAHNINEANKWLLLQTKLSVFYLKDLDNKNLLKLSRSLLKIHYKKDESSGVLQIKKRSLNKKLIAAAFTVFATFILPYIWAVSVFLGSKIAAPYYKILNLSRLIKYCKIENSLNNITNRAIRLYSSIGVFEAVFHLPIAYLGNSTSEDLQKCINIDSSYHLNFFLKNLSNEKLIDLSGQNNINGFNFSFLNSINNVGISNSLSAKNSVATNLLKYFKEVLTFNDKYSRYYLLFVTRDGNKLTPTGGRLDEGYLFEIENGNLTPSVSFRLSDLENKFKGKINSVTLLNDKDQTTLDQSITESEQFKILNILIKQVYGVYVSTLVSIDASSTEGLINYGRALNNKDLSYKESVDIYNNLDRLLTDKSISILQNDPETNNVRQVTYKSSDSNFGDCQINLGFMKTGDQELGDKTTIDVSSNLENNKLDLNISYKDDSKTKGELIIYYPYKDGWVVKYKQTPEGETQSFEGNNFLLYKIQAGVKSEVLTLSIPVSNCDNSVGVKMVSQPENKSILFNYDFSSKDQYFLYLNNNLTGEGNKFYNSKLLSLTRDFELHFIKVK